MNTFFRQKLTNKTIDLLEKVEDRKTREEEEDCLILESPTILIIVGLPALIILGMILPIFAIREGYYAGGTVVMLIFCGIGGWLTGYALFWKVVITHEKVEYHSSFFGIKRSYLLKDITKVCYNELKELKVYKGKRKVFMVESGTDGIDELVDEFRKKGICVEDLTPKQECYKVMCHPIQIWSLLIINTMIFTPFWIYILYGLYRSYQPKTMIDTVEMVACVIIIIGLNIAMVLVLVSEKVFYIQYQKGRYYCRRIFRKEEIFELDERISYKADDEFLTLYRDNRRFFQINLKLPNAYYFNSALLKNNIKCIKGEQYMEKYRDKEEIDVN